MKQLTILIAFLALSFGVKSQNATVNASGNYVAVKSVKSTTDNNKPTGKTFTDTKGNVYPVMVSANGKLFYVRTSKTGNEYKVYLKL